MRPRPATWTALVLRYVLCPCPRTRHGGSSSLTRSEKRYRRCTRQTATCEANFASRSATPRWPAASPAVCGGLCEEAATPGQPVARRSVLLEDPSQQFTLENHWAPPALPRCSGRARRTFRLMSALCSCASVRIKQKPGPVCAETVDAGDSLWKLVENPDGTPLAPVNFYLRPLPDSGKSFSAPSPVFLCDLCVLRLSSKASIRDGEENHSFTSSIRSTVIAFDPPRSKTLPVTFTYCPTNGSSFARTSTSGISVDNG
jgi:hypothetical protein